MATSRGFTFFPFWALAVFCLVHLARAQSEQPIYSFTGKPDAALPNFILVDPNSGVIFGTSSEGGATNDGTVFELIPPAAAAAPWRETILHSFSGGTDGSGPFGLAEDQKTNILYGQASGSGADTVFELIPPDPAKHRIHWTFSTLVSIPDLEIGRAPPVRDATGDVFGTGIIGGTNATGGVYEASPPRTTGAAWTARTIYSLPDGACPSEGLLSITVLAFGPGGLTFDASSGDLYANAYGFEDCTGGSAFQLVPSTAGGAWTANGLHSFPASAADGEDPSGPMVDVNGTFFGETAQSNSSTGIPGPGTIFQLFPSNSSPGWTEAPIYTFQNGEDGQQAVGGLLAFKGALFGVSPFGGIGASQNSTGVGLIFGLIQQSTGTWTFYPIYSFGGAGDGQTPMSGLVLSPPRPAWAAAKPGTILVYGTTAAGGTSNQGTVYVADLPTTPFTPGLSAICNLDCFDNSLTFRLPPFPSQNNLSFIGVVLQVAEAGQVVQFAARPLSTSSLRPIGPARTLTVTFTKPVAFSKGQRWLLIASPPRVGTKGKVVLSRYWRIDQPKPSQ
jgi:hypothetical protein